MAVQHRVRKHREVRQLQGFVRVEVMVPAESADRIRKLAARMRAQKAKVDLAHVRALVREAYRKYGASCLDNIAVDPSSAGVRQARVVADALIARGDKDAFVLGRRIRDEAHIA